MTRHIQTAALALGLALLTTCGRAEEPVRTWTDRSGEYEVEAKLLALSSDGSMVSLELVDQQSVDVAIDRLSAEDRRYLLRHKRLQSRREATERRRNASPQRRTVNLYGINWHKSLESAMDAGQPTSGGPDKPIMCFRVLGDLAGYM